MSMDGLSLEQQLASDILQRSLQLKVTGMIGDAQLRRLWDVEHHVGHGRVWALGSRHLKHGTTSMRSCSC